MNIEQQIEFIAELHRKTFNDDLIWEKHPSGDYRTKQDDISLFISHSLNGDYFIFDVDGTVKFNVHRGEEPEILFNTFFLVDEIIDYIEESTKEKQEEKFTEVCDKLFK